MKRIAALAILLVLSVACSSGTDGTVPSLGGNDATDDGSDGSDATDATEAGDGQDGSTAPDGSDGIDGRDGNDAVDGRDGNDGRDGIDAVDGRDGNDGIDGRDGNDVVDGQDGIDGVDGPALCGDAVCNEDLFDCPGDCAPAWLQCTFEACEGFVDECGANDGCRKALECVAGCPNQACAQACLAGTTQETVVLFTRIRNCAAESQCFEPPPGCGDGVCQPGETCPADCGSDPILECLENQCQDVLSGCYATPGCLEIADCVNGCESQQCFFQCLQSGSPGGAQAYQSLIDCGQGAGCFGGGPGDCGNGQCDPGESPDSCPDDCSNDVGSCEGQCGAPFQDGATCQCDFECAQFGDCCPDFDFYCANETCGDGVCQPNSNEPFTCPEDCGGSGGFECIVSSCNVGQCQNFPNCLKALQCMGQCQTADCVQGCVAAAPQQAQALLAAVGNCAVESCIGSGPECGDGQCMDSEVFTCPEDCGDVPGCGDGLCDLAAGEQFTCPDDCQDVPTCGDGVCDPNSGEPFNCPEDCSQDGCGDGKCDPMTENAFICPIDCGQAKCGDGICTPPFETAQNCFLDCAIPPGCGDGFCSSPFENATNCPKDCAQTACGDNVCQPPETSTNCPEDCGQTGSCEGKCGASFDPNLPCQCSFDCVQFQDCCDDFEALCAESFCGDGVCTDDEAQGGCTIDCGGGTGFQCVDDACSFGNCGAFQSCAAGLSCFKVCDADLACAKTCVEKASNNAKPALAGILQCGVNSGCYETVEPGPVCGDDVCEDGESAQSCPQDCSVPVDPATCVYQQCSSAVSVCIAELPCVLGLQCFAKCNGDAACAKSSCLVSADGEVVSESLMAVYECAIAEQCIK